MCDTFCSLFLDRSLSVSWTRYLMTQYTSFTITLSALICLLVTPVVAQQSRVIVSKEDCKRLVRHHPSADVEYKPGVDAHGKAVAPADLPGSRRIKLPDSYEFDLTLQVFKRLGLEVPVGLDESALKVGTVSVDKRGNVSFNGEPLDGDEEAAIAEACQDLMKQK